MENNSPQLKKHFLERLHHILAGPRRRIFCAWDRPLPGGNSGLPPYARLILFISGADTIRIADCGIPAVREFSSADMLYCVTGGWTDRQNLDGAITLSLVFFADFLRLVENHFRDGKEIAKSWYHTSERISEGTFFTLRALDALAHEGNLDQMAPLLTILMERVAGELERDKPGGDGSRSWYTYQRIMNYLSENYHVPINRESVAGDLRIDRSHITRLFRRYGNDSFNATLVRMRMENAVQLLRTQSLPVREIAGRCGYSGSEYFIKAFRQYHGVTPEQFRRRRKD